MYDIDLKLIEKIKSIKLCTYVFLINKENSCENQINYLKIENWIQGKYIADFFKCVQQIIIYIYINIYFNILWKMENMAKHGKHNNILFDIISFVHRPLAYNNVLIYHLISLVKITFQYYVIHRIIIKCKFNLLVIK